MFSFTLQIPRVDGEYDLKVPRDMAYVFSGAYVPLSCRIIEQVRTWPLPFTFPARCFLLVPGLAQLVTTRATSKKRDSLAAAGLETMLVPSQVLERRGWQGLDEVVRLLNCSELAFTGAWPSLPSGGG